MVELEITNLYIFSTLEPAQKNENKFKKMLNNLHSFQNVDRDDI